MTVRVTPKSAVKLVAQTTHDTRRAKRKREADRVDRAALLTINVPSTCFK
jgi:hypothetical protein